MTDCKGTELGLITDGIRQAANFLADTIREAKQKMAENAKAY